MLTLSEYNNKSRLQSLIEACSSNPEERQVIEVSNKELSLIAKAMLEDLHLKQFKDMPNHNILTFLMQEANILTQKDLSSLLKKSQPQTSGLLNGKVEFTVPVIKKVCSVFNITPKIFL